MKGKKLFVLTAGVLLSVTALVGCGKKKTDPTPTPGPGPDPDPVVPVPEAANGAFTYANASNADRTEILGILEKWAVDNMLTGLTLFEDGGYVMYSPLVEKGAPNYIKGFGFGTLSEGRLTGPLEGEEEAKYKMYYHTYESTEPDHLRYMDYDASISDLGYVAGGLYDIVMNETRTGYKWVGDLAKNDEPIAVDPDEDGASKVYQVPVKTGSALKYSTLTSNATLAAFNNTEVQLDDYIVPYQLYYTKAYQMKRNAEIKDATKGSIKGGQAYAAATADGFKQEEWDKVGIKGKHNDELGDYLEFTFNAAYTPFWARYYISSNMFAPVPRAFITALGGGTFENGIKIWGGWNSDASLSPKDTWLSTGPYVCEEWVKSTKHTFKRNVNYVTGTDRKVSRVSSYNIEGVYMDVITGLNEDQEAALNKFLANKLHQCGVPSKRIKDFYQDPRTTIVPGETTTKLNFNTCNQKDWEALFGVNGSITQTPEDKYWEVKPAMSNKNFIRGISYAFDRKTFAADNGFTPSNDYFGSAYYSDAEEGIFYNDTEAHKNAVADSLKDTDGYGYSVELAKKAFKAAAEEMIADGSYEVGGTIEIEMGWWGTAYKEIFAEPIENMIHAAFDNANTGLNLKITHWYAPQVLDIYYTKMMVGQFDIGFGGIEGNTYDPLNFMEVLKSDNSSTFTLNWGIPTNEKVELEWDGKLWTYDALWEVADHGGYVKDGKNVKVFDVKDEVVTRRADGGLNLDAKLLTRHVVDDKGNVQIETQLTALALYGRYVKTGQYLEIWCYPDGTTDLSYDAEGNLLPEDERDTCVFTIGEEADENGYVNLHVELSADFVDTFLYYASGVEGEEWYSLGFDVYKIINLLGEESDETYHTSLTFDEFPVIPQD